MTNRCKHGFILVIFLVCLFLSSCVEPAQISSETSSSQENRVRLNFGIIDPPPDIEKMELVYDGSPIQLKCHLHNQLANASWGIRIYVNGIVQPYYVNTSTTESVMEVFQMKSEEQRDINIKFIPVQGRAGQEIILHFITIFNPRYRVETDKYISYDNSHSVAQLVPYKLIMKDDAPISKIYSEADGFTSDIPQYYLDKYTYADRNGKPINSLLKNTEFNLYETGNDKEYVRIQSGDDLSLTLDCMGICSDFRVSLYIDHNLVELDNNCYYKDIHITPDKMTTVNYNVPMDKYGPGYHFFYVIAVPLPEKYSVELYDLIKTETRMLIIE